MRELPGGAGDAAASTSRARRIPNAGGTSHDEAPSPRRVPRSRRRPARGRRTSPPHAGTAGRSPASAFSHGLPAVLSALCASANHGLDAARPSRSVPVVARRGEMPPSQAPRITAAEASSEVFQDQGAARRGVVAGPRLRDAWPQGARPRVERPVARPSPCRVQHPRARTLCGLPDVDQVHPARSAAGCTPTASRGETAPAPHGAAAVLASGPRHAVHGTAGRGYPSHHGGGQRCRP